MGLFHQFPYTDLNGLNLSWIIQTTQENAEKITELFNKLSDYENAANKYTDEQIELLRKEIEDTLTDYRNYTENKVAEMQTLVDDTIRNVDNQIKAVYEEIENQRDEIEQEFDATNARTDAVIAANNEYIFDKISNDLLDVKVVNYFTGETVTVQQMFDYLSQFHVTNAITYTELAAKNITYDQLAALDITYTQLAINGGSLIN